MSEDNRQNILFLAALVLIFLTGAVSFVRTPKKTSVSENRTLEQFEHFTVGGFMDGSFQDNFENALSDQFMLSEKIRTVYGRAISSLPAFGIDRIACTNRYLALPNSVDSKRVTFNCEDYIVVLPNTVQQRVYDNIKKYNKINTENDVYYYLIETYRTYDFEKDENIGDYVSVLQENLKGKYHLGFMENTGYDYHKKYFYKTDHHWNYEGSYKGFLDIVKMFGIENPSEPTGTFTSEEYFYGSHARTTKNYSYLEKFTIYTFDIPEHDVTINGIGGKKYNHYAEFMDHGYEYNRDLNFYAYVYGNDYGEIVFDFHQPDKPNLLIISNSYSNAINELVAQYFNKTYVVDMRHYEKYAKTEFKYSEYIKKNKIGKTLILGNDGFVADTELNQGLEL